MPKISHKTLPTSPGVYIMKNEAGTILYVGKAKNLRKRVSTYFTQPNKLQADKQLMMPQITKLEHIVTDTEIEALLLETTLIKRHRPKFNVRFKDDKNYQYIKVDYSWDFPKIYTVRQIEDTNREAQYFGPFTDGWAVKKTVELLRKLFRYRTCNREIPYDLAKLYSSPCLNHHIKLCLGPCIGAVSKQDYEKTIHNCVQFLQGKQTNIVKELKTEMKKESAHKNFEQAARLRDQLNDIEHIVARQKVVSTKSESLDIISFFEKDLVAAFNVFLVRAGNLIGKENFLLDYNKPHSGADLLGSFLELYYSSTKSLPKQIILPTEVSPETKKLLTKVIGERSRAILVPTKGKLKKLVSLGKQNARDYWERQKQIEETEPADKVLKLKKILDLKKAPIRIEAYDISNLQGTNPTGSMVVFRNGSPEKSQYRRFKIRTKDTPDDVAMLKESLTRRFQHQDWPRPDLVLIDGGKPQLNIARKTVPKNIPVISIAKREEEIFVSGKTKPIKLTKDNAALQLLQQLRDEAHRFAITHHTGLRQKQGLTSKLDKIPGIGPATRKKLIKRFGSVAGIRRASEAELIAEVSAKITKSLRENL